MRDLLTQTAQLAADAPKRFATTFMDAATIPMPTLYSLAQCTPDLNGAECLACLR
jgi:hypothetical protein